MDRGPKGGGLCVLVCMAMHVISIDSWKQRQTAKAAATAAVMLFKNAKSNDPGGVHTPEMVVSAYAGSLSTDSSSSFFSCAIVREGLADSSKAAAPTYHANAHLT